MGGKLMIQRRCPECDGELVLARLPDGQHAQGIKAHPSTFWRCSICGGTFTSDQIRENKRARQLDRAAE
jgi:ribosomal protein S27E